MPEPANKIPSAEMGEELYEMLGVICPRFRDVPDVDKEVVSRHMAGLSVELIAAQTGRGEKGVQMAIDRWAGLVEQVPEEVKVRLSLLMIINAVPALCSVVCDRRKIEKLKPEDAIKVLDVIPKVMGTLMKMERDYIEHKRKVSEIDYSGFGKTLTEGK